MRKINFKRKYTILFTAVLLLLAAITVQTVSIPDRVCILPTGAVRERLPGGVLLNGEGTVTCTVNETNRYADAAADFCSHRTVQAKLLGVLPLKTVDVTTVREKTVYPGGMLFGMRLAAKGVIVCGFCDVDGALSPAIGAGMRSGDVILAAGNGAVDTAQSLIDRIEAAGKDGLRLTVLRGGKEMQITLIPKKTEQGYRAGMLVRDNAAGIGTVTFIDPETLVFGGLGHGVCDAETGTLFPLGTGTVYGVRLGGVHRGAVGIPGELRGSFAPTRIGTLSENTGCGVFGILSSGAYETLGEPVPLGFSDVIHEGDAQILSAVTPDGTVGRYTAQITKILGGTDNKSFVLVVTDAELLEKTGGIVQGMSGSPVLQDGRLVGAVTHVMVNDPTKGYGVFIENMLANMQTTP